MLRNKQKPYVKAYGFLCVMLHALGILRRTQCAKTKNAVANATAFFILLVFFPAFDYISAHKCTLY